VGAAGQPPPVPLGKLFERQRIITPVIRIRATLRSRTALVSKRVNFRSELVLPPLSVRVRKLVQRALHVLQPSLRRQYIMIVDIRLRQRMCYEPEFVSEVALPS
jgi:hypothetical protein